MISSAKGNNPHRPLTVLIHPTWMCNLKCLYCYSGKSDCTGMMSYDTVRKAIYALADYNAVIGRSKIIWHGGEPTLMGMDFYKEVLRIQSEFGTRHIFSNLVQTNATTPSEEFLDFLIDNHFRLGISLDGPEHINDFQRRNKANKGTYSHILRTIEYLRSKGVRINALSVMTANTLRHLDDYYAFIKNGLVDSVKINPLIRSGYAQEHPEIGIAPSEYAEAMNYLFDLWLNEPKLSFSIEPLVEMLQTIVTGIPKTCAFDGSCFNSFIGIDYEGTIMPCGKWAESEYRFGNVNNISIQDALVSSAANEFRRKRMIALKECSKCMYYQLCKGGCPHNAYAGYKSIEYNDYFCEAYRIMFQHLGERLQKEIKHDASKEYSII